MEGITIQELKFYFDENGNFNIDCAANWYWDLLFPEASLVGVTEFLQAGEPNSTLYLISFDAKLELSFAHGFLSVASLSSANITKAVRNFTLEETKDFINWFLAEYKTRFRG